MILRVLVSMVAFAASFAFSLTTHAQPTCEELFVEDTWQSKADVFRATEKPMSRETALASLFEFVYGYDFAIGDLNPGQRRTLPIRPRSMSITSRELHNGTEIPTLRSTKTETNPPSFQLSLAAYGPEVNGRPGFRFTMHQLGKERSEPILTINSRSRVNGRRASSEQTNWILTTLVKAAAKLGSEKKNPLHEPMYRQLMHDLNDEVAIHQSSTDSILIEVRLASMEPPKDEQSEHGLPPQQDILQIHLSKNAKGQIDHMRMRFLTTLDTEKPHQQTEQVVEAALGPAR